MAQFKWENKAININTYQKCHSHSFILLKLFYHAANLLFYSHLYNGM